MTERKVICRSLVDITAKPTSHGIGMKSVLLKSDESTSNVTQITKTKLLKGEFIENHIHPTMDEHFIFLTGKACMEINGFKFDCFAGTFIMIPAGSNHNLKALSDLEIITLGIVFNR